MTNNYYLYSVILKGCPYSQAGHDLINSFEHIKKEFSFIEHHEKENYKTDLISTFPQIYLKKEDNNGTQLIGGYTDLKKIIDMFYHNSTDDNIKSNIEIYLKENTSWNKKSLLRLIELLHSKKFI